MIDNKYSITLVNLYGPNRDNPKFYSELSDKINDFFDTDFIIMCGDWNVVQDYQLDCFNYLRENNPKNKIEIEFKSQSFLQQQVRSMVGCLKYLGEKKWDLKKFDKVFKSKKRVLCAPPAPPEGLFLARVIY